MRRIRLSTVHICKQISTLGYYLYTYNNIFIADRRPNGRRPYYRGGRRGPLRRPRPPPQDSQGEDKTEGTEGECCSIFAIYYYKCWLCCSRIKKKRHFLFCAPRNGN